MVIKKLLLWFSFKNLYIELMNMQIFGYFVNVGNIYLAAVILIIKNCERCKNHRVLGLL